MFGVPEYWIVDAGSHAADVLARDGDTCRTRQRCRGDAVVQSVVAPGPAFPAASVFPSES